MSRLFDRIGTGYDQTRRPDGTIVKALARLLAAEPSGRYLDLGCGTGNYTSALMEAGLELVGIDPSPVMLHQAKSKAPGGTWLRAVAEALPFEDAVFDGALTTLAIHHFQDLGNAFREVRRTLKAGRYVILTAAPAQTRGYWLNHYFPEMMQKSADVMPEPDAVARALRQAGFENIAEEPWSVPASPSDHFLYSGKHRPELYFDPAIRRGISSFADLALGEEVERGLARLAADIESGRIAEVQAAYANDQGDYLFIHGEVPGAP